MVGIRKLLVVDHDEERWVALRQGVEALGIVVRPCQEVTDNKDAIAFIDREDSPPGPTSELPKQFEQALIRVSTDEVVLLHTSNTWSKEFFVRRCWECHVVCFSGGHQSDTWFNERAKTDAARHRFVGFRDIKKNLIRCLERWSGEDVPWDCLQYGQVGLDLLDQLWQLDILVQGAEAALVEGKSISNEWFDGLIDAEMASVLTTNEDNDAFVEKYLRPLGPALKLPCVSLLFPSGIASPLIELARGVSMGKTGKKDVARYLSDTEILREAHMTFKSLVEKLCATKT